MIDNKNNNNLLLKGKQTRCEQNVNNLLSFFFIYQSALIGYRFELKGNNSNFGIFEQKLLEIFPIQFFTLFSMQIQFWSLNGNCELVNSI